MTNVGAEPAASLRLAPSHPAFFGLAAAEGTSAPVDAGAAFPEACFDTVSTEHAVHTSPLAWPDSDICMHACIFMYITTLYT